MKSTSKHLVFLLTCLTLAANVYAQSPREQLSQLVEQLQKSPGDTTLRERIVKLGAELKPAPAIPEEARRSFVEGVTIVKSAKDTSSQTLAIESFNEALKIAPWWGDAYYNLAVTQELIGQLADAERTLKWFILSNPGESDARDAQDRIYAIGAKRKLAAAKSAADTPQAREAPLLQKVEGARFVAHVNYAGGMVYDRIYEIKDRTLHITLKVISLNLAHGQSVGGHNKPGEYLQDRVPYRDGVFTSTNKIWTNITFVISIRPDGEALIIHNSDGYEGIEGLAIRQ